ISQQHLSSVLPVTRQVIFCPAPSTELAKTARARLTLKIEFFMSSPPFKFHCPLLFCAYSAQRKIRGIFLNPARRDLFGAVIKFLSKTQRWSDIASQLALKPVERREDEARQFGVLSKEDAGDRHHLTTGSGAHTGNHQRNTEK